MRQSSLFTRIRFKDLYVRLCWKRVLSWVSSHVVTALREGSAGMHKYPLSNMTLILLAVGVSVCTNVWVHMSLLCVNVCLCECYVKGRQGMAQILLSWWTQGRLCIESRSCRKYPMWRWRWYSGGERKPGQQTGLSLNQAVVFSFFYQFQVHKGLCELFSHSFITFKRILPSVTH